MRPFAQITAFLGVLCLLAADPIGIATAAAQEEAARIPQGVYLELTESFYEALKRDPRQGATVYSNDPSAADLREIAVSAQFVVKTNLEILKQQEEMIRLLRRLLEKQ